MSSTYKKLLLSVSMLALLHSCWSGHQQFTCVRQQPTLAVFTVRSNFKDTTAGANGKKALPFRVTSIKEAVKEGSSGSLKGADSSASVGGGCELQLVVNPGFDVSEWIQLEALMAAGARAKAAAAGSSTT
eukprot:12702-Heterococcus_DN1.PRE.1